MDVSFIQKLARPKSFREMTRILRLRWRGQSDFEKWGDADNLKERWADRSRVMAKMIPNGARVVEFGAGKMLLREFLDSSCHYTPSDLVDRGPGTVVCDLNDEELPQFPDQDVAFLAGVLEYIHDVDRLARYLSENFQTVILSYVTLDGERSLKLADRRSRGWVNDYRTEELVLIFEDKGYQMEEKGAWKTQSLFRFETRSSN